MVWLKERLEKYGLELAEDKTRILPIGRNFGTKDEFDFLGFTFYNAKTREGKGRLGIRTSQKKLKAKRQAEDPQYVVKIQLSIWWVLEPEKRSETPLVCNWG